jgi:selenocysteine lyase/cysteine desulfurase
VNAARDDMNRHLLEASCRFSFYLYNTLDEVDRAVDALADIVSFGSGASRRPLHSKVPE